MTNPRMEICLNGLWERHDGELSGPGAWKTVRVPEEFTDFSRESAWYRLQFLVPEDFRGKQIQLEIGRVRFYGRAEVNGTVVGESWQPRLPLQADITACAKPGEMNELKVYAHCLAEGVSNPGEPLKEPGARGALLDYYDTHDMAAIMGDVLLTCCPLVQIFDVQILPSVRNQELVVRIGIANHCNETTIVSLNPTVRTAKKVALQMPNKTVIIGPGELIETEIKQAWRDPILWGPRPLAEPFLYHLQIDVTDDGKLIDRRQDRFGFRELWNDGNRFVFNGKPIFMMGTHISDFEMREAMTLLVPKLQQAGFLFVHPHADPRLRSFYDVCDELGMLIWDCSFCAGPIGNNYGRWKGDADADIKTALPHLKTMYREWVQRNRNHPSIAVWSAGCNNYSVNSELKRVIEEEDPSRPVTIYDEPDSPQDVKMFGFQGWNKNEVDYSKGKATIDKEIAARGSKKYPLWISEYWSQSGRPEALKITWEKAVAGGCAFDVGGYLGCFPPFHQSIEASWPSQSGVGQRRHSLLLRGHKKTFVEHRHLNWCDSSKSVFAGEWAEEKGYREVSEKAGVGITPADKRYPEIIVTARRGGQPAANAYVYVEARENQPFPARGVMTDTDGKAWFVLAGEGLFSASFAGKSVEFRAELQPIRSEPGYGYIKHLAITA